MCVANGWCCSMPSNDELWGAWRTLNADDDGDDYDFAQQKLSARVCVCSTHRRTLIYSMPSQRQRNGLSLNGCARITTDIYTVSYLYNVHGVCLCNLFV